MERTLDLKASFSGYRSSVVTRHLQQFGAVDSSYCHMMDTKTICVRWNEHDYMIGKEYCIKHGVGGNSLDRKYGH
jgi:hypothetical protein